MLLWVYHGAAGQHELTRSIEVEQRILSSDSNDKDALRRIGMLMLNKADYDNAILYGTQLLDLAYEQQDFPCCMHAHICLGQAHVMKGDQTKAYNHLHQALALATTAGDRQALCSIYNGLGLYALNIEKDYYRSINYFLEGIDIALSTDNRRMYSLMLCNMSGVYYLKRDTTGLKYALECYEVGHAIRDPYIIYCGAVNTAYMHYMLGQYDTALNYIKEGEFQALSNDFHDITNVYCIYGLILAKQDVDPKAEAMFEKALELKKTAQTTSVVNTYLGYGTFLSGQGNYIKAIELLKAGEALSRDEKNHVYLSDVLEGLALCYGAIGNYPRALEYYKLFQDENMRNFNADKERNLNEIRTKYDTERAENLLRQNQLALLQKEKRLQLLIAVVVFFAVAAGLLSYLYYRKNKLYTAIVRQSHEAIQRQERLEDKLAGYEGRYVSSSLSDEKSTTIFSSLEKLMRDERVYSDCQLTKDKVAAMIGTNRTYLSQIINEQTGGSFTQYVNSFRIQEATRLLSDTGIDRPLKAICSDVGFSSRTTFYNLFREAVGMTPSQYRQRVVQLYGNS